ncbi:MAG TPA: hypothetical protein VHK89_02925 [Actinomycetota bacterium]|nr:hypothetical protein [Actinomycetota bacterium]
MSLRFRLRDDPRHPFSEAVGVVGSVTGPAGEEELTVLSRRGAATRVPVADIEALKVFPLQGPPRARP